MSGFVLEFTNEALSIYDALKTNPAQQGLFDQVKKCIRFLRSNPRHPSLNTHPYSSLLNPIDPKQKVFEAYAQNKTPGAYRVFWIYGSAKRPPTKGKVLTIITITSHP
jgi:hypothetical protein